MVSRAARARHLLQVRAALARARARAQACGKCANDPMRYRLDTGDRVQGPLGAVGGARSQVARGRSAFGSRPVYDRDQQCTTGRARGYDTYCVRVCQSYDANNVQTCTTTPTAVDKGTNKCSASRSRTGPNRPIELTRNNKSAVACFSPTFTCNSPQQSQRLRARTLPDSLRQVNDEPSCVDDLRHSAVVVH